MTHDQVFDAFESLDIYDTVIVKLQDGAKEMWKIYDVHLETEGLYLQYFPVGKGEDLKVNYLTMGEGKLELAFIPVEPPCSIKAVRTF